MPGMLHAERKRLKEMAEAEAKGQSFWTNKFETPVRVKISLALKASTSVPAAADMVLTVAHEEGRRPENRPGHPRPHLLPAGHGEVWPRARREPSGRGDHHRPIVKPPVLMTWSGR
jgi:hypothetical protein